MNKNSHVKLEQIIKDFSLKVEFKSSDAEDIIITSTDINRPGLQLIGFFDYFDNSRLQIIGRVEMTYLETQTEDGRYDAFIKLFETKIPAIIVTRGLEIFPEMLKAAEIYNVPILVTNETTSAFMSNIITYLHTKLAPSITRHGVLVEVYGEGIFLTGDSGVGKSETAMELLKRGHRLIADDAVEIKRVSNQTLVGTAPEIIRHFIELRGIGIVDVRRLFGIGAVKETEKLNMVIELELWDETKQYDRLGLDEQYTEILGIKLPSLRIPIKPGRNLAIIIEVAAMNLRQKRLGYNAAAELNKRIEAQYNF